MHLGNEGEKKILYPIETINKLLVLFSRDSLVNFFVTISTFKKKGVRNNTLKICDNNGTTLVICRSALRYNENQMHLR